MVAAKVIREFVQNNISNNINYNIYVNMENEEVSEDTNDGAGEIVHEVHVVRKTPRNIKKVINVRRPLLIR